jgi:hypothetical protein
MGGAKLVFKHTLSVASARAKRKCPSLGLRAAEAFTAPVTPDSELAAETATSSSRSAGAVPERNHEVRLVWLLAQLAALEKVV